MQAGKLLEIINVKIYFLRSVSATSWNKVRCQKKLFCPLDFRFCQVFSTAGSRHESSSFAQYSYQPGFWGAWGFFLFFLAMTCIWEGHLYGICAWSPKFRNTMRKQSALSGISWNCANQLRWKKRSITRDLPFLPLLFLLPKGESLLHKIVIFFKKLLFTCGEAVRS